MSTFLMILGSISALGISSQKPSYFNYSSAALAIGCFAVAAFIEVAK